MIKSNQPVDLTVQKIIKKTALLLAAVNNDGLQHEWAPKREVLARLKGLGQNNNIFDTVRFIEKALFSINLNLAAYMPFSSRSPLDCPERHVPHEKASASVQLFGLILNSKQFKTDGVSGCINTERLDRTRVSLNSICAYQSDVAEKHKDQIAQCKEIITNTLAMRADAAQARSNTDMRMKQQKMRRATQQCKR